MRIAPGSVSSLPAIALCLALLAAGCSSTSSRAPADGQPLYASQPHDAQPAAIVPHDVYHETYVR
jgi:hypothetical protein